MKTYETQIDKTVTVLHASSMPAGYGHQRITVQMQNEDGDTREFSAITYFMPGFDAANELEGQEKYEALYELIENKIADEVYEWLVEE
jgi:hypothetical protein